MMCHHLPCFRLYTMPRRQSESSASHHADFPLPSSVAVAGRWINP